LVARPEAGGGARGGRPRNVNPLHPGQGTGHGARRDMSDTITEGIRIVVRPSFWAERSAPENGQFAFSYAVQIANEGTAPAQLRNRHWVITDANGHVEEVRGEGVV